MPLPCIMTVNDCKAMADEVKKQTCVQCRKRKVRCDGELGGCSNCQRLQFSCLFLSHSPDDATPSPSLLQSSSSRIKYTIGGIERRRGSRACRPCRASKSRCGGGWPKCRHCEQRGLDCQYPPSRRRKNVNNCTFTSTHSFSYSQEPETVRMPDYIQNAEDALSKPIANMELADKTFLESHVTAFFEYFNSIPQYNFIHKPTFLRSFHHNNLDPLFLRCVCGIASRFVQPNTEDYTSDWLREVEAQIWPRISEMKVQNLQILLLLICWYSLSRKISSMWTASAMAARMAYGIRLNHEADGKMPFVSKEVRRRLMWSIFMLDRLYAGGFPELTLCATETIHINLPCEERNFDLDIPLSTPVLKPTITTPELESGIGIMGYITRLIDIRHAILECTKLIIASKTNPYTARESIRGLDSRLRIFSESLPAHLKESHRNLLCRAYTSDLTGYINLHTLWRQCHCDLYRMMIPGIRESVTEDIQRQVPIDYAENCRRLCLHHALAMCKLWSDTLSEAHVFWLSDQSIGIYAYQCANILVNLWDLDCDAGLKAELTIISSFLDRLAVLYPVVAEIQSEINGFITSLDVVTDFYQAHSDGMLSQTLTAAWRSTLRQQGIQEGQTASKFSLLEFLHNQNKVEDANADEDYSVPNIDAPPEPSTLNGTDMGLGISATSDKPYLLDELWSSAQLEMDFDSFGTRVDPFCRIFDDWSLAVE